MMVIFQKNQKNILIYGKKIRFMLIKEKYFRKLIKMLILKR